jgi:flagellar basal-body rod protein FlgB
MQKLFSRTMDLLANMLFFREVGHKVIASNVANIDTPGYKPSTLDFRENLDEIIKGSNTLSLAATHPMHMQPEGESPHFAVSVSGDKVDIDKEMADLAQNQIMYNTTVELLARKFRGLQTVLKETR